LVKQSVLGSAASKSRLAEGARKRRSTFPSRQEALSRYGGRPPLNRLDDRALRAYVENGFDDASDGTVTLRCLPETEASVFEQTTSETYERAGQLTIPYAMAASGDGGIPALSVLEAAADFPQLELVDCPTLSHFGPLEDPEGIADQIGAWFLAT